jgi:preprotein translocase subunit SecG
MTIALSILFLIASLFLVVVILFQSGKSAGISGAIGGGADNFFAKGKAKSLAAAMTVRLGLDRAAKKLKKR